MSHIMDLIAQWSVRVIGACGLAAAAGYCILWLVDRALTEYMAWRGILKSWREFYLTEYSKRLKTKPLPKGPALDPHRSID